MSRRNYDRSPSWAQPAPPIRLDQASAEMLDLVRQRLHEDEFLQELLRLAQGVATPAVACSATVCRDGRPSTVAITSPLATFADEVQYGSHETPCLRCLHTGRPVAVPSMASEYRWRDFAERAFAQGVGCSLSLPLLVRGEIVGSVNVYAADAGALTGSEQETLSALAARAGGCLAVLRQHVQSGERVASSAV